MLCMSRRAAGKPALAIAWGPVDHVGYVAEILKVCTLYLCTFLHSTLHRQCNANISLPCDVPRCWGVSRNRFCDGFRKLYLRIAVLFCRVS